MSSSLQRRLKSSGWALLSTRDSINRGIPSVTAIIETAIAVPLYWWLAIRLETYALLLISAAVAPLVLLRSDESVDLGVRWFDAWELNIYGGKLSYFQLDTFERRVACVAMLLAAVVSGIVCGILYGRYFDIRHEWTDFLPGFLIVWLTGALLGTLSAASVSAIAIARPTRAGLVALVVGLTGMASSTGAVVAFFAISAGTATVLGALVALMLVVLTKGSGAKVRARSKAGVLELTGMSVGSGRTRELLFPLSIPFLLYAPLGIFLLSLIIRICSTLRHPIKGVRSLSQNWRRLTLCTSPLQMPELVPGLRDGARFTPAGVLSGFRSGRQADELSSKILAFSLHPIALLLWFVPGWIYRATLKSTAWLWWPLAFIGGELQRASEPAEFRRTVIGSLWAKTTIAFSLATIAVFFASNFVLSGAVFKANPLLNVLGYFVLVDWTMLPWQALTLALATLSIAIVYLVDDVSGRYQTARTNNDLPRMVRAEDKLRWIERLARLRLVMSIALWLLVGAQAVLYFNSFGAGLICLPTRSSGRIGFTVPRRLLHNVIQELYKR